ncbi:MAG: hypothetical protein IJ590_00530 [Rickettsiales bacterium]|nr:hypothetical protein [Rickettsiales bacterium]
MKIEEKMKKTDVDQVIKRLPSVSILDDDYKTNYEEIATFQKFFDHQDKTFYNNSFKIDIASDYPKWLDKQYKCALSRPLTRSEYTDYIQSLHDIFVDNYVQPLWENMLHHNLKKVNELKKQMRKFLQK